MVAILAMIGCGTTEPAAPPPEAPPPPAPTERVDRKQGALGCDGPAMLEVVKASPSVDPAVRDALQGKDPICQGRVGRLIVTGGAEPAVALLRREGPNWRLLDFGTGIDAASCAEQTGLPQEVCQELTGGQ